MATTLVTQSKTKFSTKPFPDPPFTIKDIRAAIPQELYKIDELYGTLWFLWTHIRMWLIFFIILPYVVYPLTGLSFIIGYIIWVFIAGLSIWGSWTEGHECMHNLVSNYWLLNDIYGFLCMTPAMNPYYAAKTIHMKHHNNTAHIVRDSFPFRPNTQKDSRNAPRWFSWLKEHGLSPFVPFIGMWGVYGDITGDGDGNQYNIFDNKIYKPNIKEKFKGFLSISACIIFQILLFNIFGFKNTMIYYWGPFQVFCFWSFTMTWLHHNHPKIHYFRDPIKKKFFSNSRNDGTERYQNHDGWSYLKGQLQTVDRDFGWFFNHMMNNYNYHLAHHMSLRIPHYRLKETTKYVKNVIGDYYLWDDRPWYISYFKDILFCHTMPDVGNDIRYTSY